MKKLVKLLFGRFTIILLTIGLQVALIVAAVVYFSPNIAILFVISAGLTFVSLLFILCRDMAAEYKIPWIFVVVSLQLLGVVVYALFSRVTMTRKHRKNASKVHGQLVSASLDVTGMDEESRAQATYLYRTAKSAPYRDTKVNYFDTGVSYWNTLKEDIAKAEHFIFLEYFIIEEGKMWNGVLDLLKEKASQGVAVRIIYDDIGTINRLPYRYDKRVTGGGIECRCFNKFTPAVSVLHNNRDHRKIAVIDGRVAYTGGINLADEYINETHPYGVWKDSGIRLEGLAVDELTQSFLTTWNMIKHTDEDFSVYRRAVAVKESGWVQPFSDSPKPYDDVRVGEEVYLNLINGATKTLYITTPYLIVSRSFLETIRRAARRGVDVKLIVPHVPDKKIVFALTRHNYRKLLSAGVEVYEYTPGFLHAKTCIADGRMAFCGTVNLDYRSFVHHLENGVWMCDVPAITEMNQDFFRTLAVSEKKTEEEKRRKGVLKRAALALLNIFSPLF